MTAPRPQRSRTRDRNRHGLLAATLVLVLLRHAHGQELRLTVSTVQPPTVAAIALSIKSRAIQDSRCYLMNGGAVESFFISEDTPVGAVIGTLSVNGDPSEIDGNIVLSLQEKSAPVGIAAWSKNVTLLRALDREEAAGPSNVYVNVRCDRRRTTDPSFIIPVSVRVWDVNDNAPAWVGAPYRVRLSELTAVGSRILQGVRATDLDQPGPHSTIHYAVLDGPHSEYFGFVNELDSVLVVKKPLDYETLANFTVTLRAQDQGNPPLHNDTTLEVEVLDADDQNPKFNEDSYMTFLPDDAKEGDVLELSPGPLSARDQDAGILAPLYYAAAGEHRHLLAIERDSGLVAVTQRLLAPDVQLPITVVIKATQYDNADRYALATLTVGRRSSGVARPVRFTQSLYSAAVPEDMPVGSVLLTLATSHMRDKSPLQFFVSERGFLDKFAINSAGELLLRRPLDYETQESYYYQVMVTDGVANDTSSLNITVLNVNDWEPRFRYPQYEFRVDEAGADQEAHAAGLLPVGKVDVFDGDKGDYVALSVRGPDASMFYINDMGEMFLKSEALSALNSSLIHVVATAQDSGTPPRQTSVPVLVHVSETLLGSRGGGGGRGATRGGAGLVLALFAGALAVLALLVLLLLAYIYRAKRAKPPPSSKQSRGFVEHEKLPPQSGALGVGGAGGGGGGGGSLLSVSAGASTILANSSSSLDLRGDTLATNTNGHHATHATIGRQSTRFPNKSKVAPAPPALVCVSGALGGCAAAPGADGGALALMSDHVSAAAANRSGVAWPSATIPARVKKLSWDDAAQEHKGIDDADREGGEITDATNPTVADHMNLTVYF